MDVDSKTEARFLVPPVMRRDALIVGPNRFTPQGIRQTLEDAPELFGGTPPSSVEGGAGG